jgi:hypothetical protein
VGLGIIMYVVIHQWRGCIVQLKAEVINFLKVALISLMQQCSHTNTRYMYLYDIRCIDI